MTSFPNPSTQFKPGQSGNPGGKSSAHRKAEVEAAELAATVRLELVKAVADAIEGASTEEKQMQIRSDVLNLLKQSEDRAHGSPKQSVDNTSSDGSMSPVNVSGDVLDAIRRKHGVKDED